MTTLSLIELTKTPLWYEISLIGILFLAFIIGILTQHMRYKNNISNVTAFVAFVLTIVLLVSLFIFGLAEESFKVPSGKFHIEATFSDDMPFNSVMKEYNIVEQHGDIFILEPKERKVD